MFKRFHNIVKTFGVGVAFWICLDRLGILKYHALGIFLHDLSGLSQEGFYQHSARARMRMGCAVTAREVRLDEIKSLRFAEGLYDMAFIEKRFEDYARLFCVLHQGQVIGMCFLTTISAELSSVKRPCVWVPPDMIYTFGAIVATEHKQKGIGTYVMQALLRRAKQDGKRAAFLSAYLKTDVFNWHLTNGYKHWGYLHYVRVLGKDHCWTDLTATGQSHPQLLTTG